MSDGIIARRKSKDIYLSGAVSAYSLDVLTASEEYIAPSNILEVTTVGGGGGISNATNNSAMLEVTKGEIIPVTVGLGGNGTGGTTSFGTYLASEGGNTTQSNNNAYMDRGLGGNNSTGTDGVVVIKYYE